MKLGFRSIAVLAAAMGILTSAWALPPQAETAHPTFVEHVAPIIQEKCLSCHTSAAPMGELVLESYEALMKGGDHGRVVVPGSSGQSRLVLMLEGKLEPRMPFGMGPLAEEEIATIKAWIDMGAIGPEAGTAATLAVPKAVIPDIQPRVPVVSPVGSVAFAPDGSLLAVGGSKEVRLVDPKNGKILATLAGHAGLVTGIAFGPDGDWLAAAGGLPARWGEIKLWDLETRTLRRTFEGHDDSIYAVAVSPDGKLLASGSYDKLIKLWDVESGKELRTLKDHIDSVFAVTFSPNGEWLASGAADRSVKIWDVATGKRLFTMSEPLDGLNSVVFHPSGKQVAAAGLDKTIRTWDLTEKGGKLAQAAYAHEGAILQLLYLPDGKTLLSTSVDRTIRLWDAAKLSPLRVFEEQPDWVQAMSVSPDGKRLAVGRYDGSVTVYDLETDRPILGPWVAFDTYRPASK